MSSQGLFGFDIAGILDRALQAAGGLCPGVLYKTSPGGGARDDDNPTSRTPSETRHDFEGFLEHRVIRRPETLISEDVSVLTIIGDSVAPAAVPVVGDKAELVLPGGSLRQTLVRLLERDPASAVYEFEVN